MQSNHTCRYRDTSDTLSSTTRWNSVSTVNDIDLRRPDSRSSIAGICELSYGQHLITRLANNAFTGHHTLFSFDGIGQLKSFVVLSSSLHSH